MPFTSYGQYDDEDEDAGGGGEDEQEQQELIVRITEKKTIDI